MSKGILDVAVIGGGVSGAYSAWRLKESNHRLRVGLFEYSNRIGGRLYTRTLPGMPHVHAELGGMRYIPKTQLLVTNLIEFLDLPSVPFLMGDPNPPADNPSGPPVGANNNIYYLRQKHIRLRELTKVGEIPYGVNWNERGLDPDHLQAKVMNYLVPNNASLTPDGWFDVKVFGRELYKFGFWNLLGRVLTNEAYVFMKDAGGYDANVANANAVSQLPVGEFGPSVVFRTLKDGYQKLPETLVDSFTAAGGEVHKNHRLFKISKDHGVYRLHFKPTTEEEVAVTAARLHLDESKAEEMADPRVGASTLQTCDDVSAAEVVISARKVVLAMPRRSLELIDWLGWKAPRVRDMLESVLIQAAFKLFLGYDRPWWRSLGLYAGRSITDLPIRQIYYFGTEGEQYNADPNNLNSLLMASYNDISTVPFWKGSENDDPFDGYDNEFLPTGTKPMDLGHNLVTKGMIELATSQLASVHSQVSLPEPYTAVYHDWTDDPFGGGWHEWKAGIKYNKLMPQIRKPVADEDVFICGEAYSNNQGWVEGALQTAERMLEDHFDLDRPSWLPGNCDLSW